jgi:hypothetical protein
MTIPFNQSLYLPSQAGCRQSFFSIDLKGEVRQGAPSAATTESRLANSIVPYMGFGDSEINCA